jgi:hypothetical protein
VLRFVSIGIVLGIFSFGVVLGQDALDATLRGQLEQLFPDAESFSEKEGSPPHFKAYGPKDADGQGELLGVAYWTTELEPLERGFDGPIKMLVGMDTTGVPANQVNLPDALIVTAKTAEGEIMGVRHRKLNVVGVQFHPESVLTPDGPALLGNFLTLSAVEQ